MLYFPGVAKGGRGACRSPVSLHHIICNIRNMFCSVWESHSCTEGKYDISVVTLCGSKCADQLPKQKVISVTFGTLKVLVTTIDAQWEGMGDVGSARYEPTLLPPCPTIRVLSYSK